jgi:hypothetical protein
LDFLLGECGNVETVVVRPVHQLNAPG